MLTVDVLYLIMNNRSTDIVSFNDKKIINIPIDTIIDRSCNIYLSTKEARIKTIKERYKINQYIPIYINPSIILQPLYPKKHWNQIYLNMCNVKNIIPGNNINQSIIIFNNDLNIIFDVPYQKLKQYLEKCMLIKRDQLKLLNII